MAREARKSRRGGEMSEREQRRARREAREAREQRDEKKTSRTPRQPERGNGIYMVQAFADGIKLSGKVAEADNGLVRVEFTDKVNERILGKLFPKDRVSQLSGGGLFVKGRVLLETVYAKKIVVKGDKIGVVTVDDEHVIYSALDCDITTVVKDLKAERLAKEAEEKKKKEEEEEEEDEPKKKKRSRDEDDDDEDRPKKKASSENDDEEPEGEDPADDEFWNNNF